MCGFSKPSSPPAVTIPTPEPLPAQPAAAPQEQDAAVSQSKENERTRRLRAAAANNTLVTGGDGLTTSANTTGNSGKQLFGV